MTVAGGGSGGPPRPPRADPSDPFAALAACYVALVLAMAAHPEVEAGIEPDLAWTVTGIPIAGFNRVMAPRLAPGRADERVIETLDRYRDRRSSVSWWLDPGATPRDLSARLGRLGLVADEPDTPAMALDLDGLPATTSGDAIAIHPVRDVAGLRVANGIAAEGFGVPAELVDALVERLALAGLGPGAPLHVVVASLDGRPVGTALAFVSGEVAAVYNVATVPDARGHGVGRAATAAVCRIAAARGARVAVLESSPMGYPLYRRMGFRDVGRFRILQRDVWG